MWKKKQTKNIYFCLENYNFSLMIIEFSKSKL